MERRPELLLIGDGRLARHLARYFGLLGLRHVAWSRRMHAEGHCSDLEALVHSRTHALLAISDDAVEPFISSHGELERAVRVHFSGRLASPLAIGAHPLFSFAGVPYERHIYARIPFVIDRGAPTLAELIPGLPNPAFFIEPARRARYHALCVLAGNFTTMLWKKLCFELDAELSIGRESVLPYLDSVTSAMKESGAPLTGPLSRGDRITVKRNIEALKDDPFEDVYRAFVQAYERQGQLKSAKGGKDWLAS